MVTVSHIVKKYIQKRPFIEEALSKGIINYGALAEDILPEVENEIGKKIKHSAVMMALRRHSAEVLSLKQAKFGSSTDVKIVSDLAEITIYKSPEIIKKIYDSVDLRKDFLSIIVGVSETSIITNRRNEKKILSLIRKSDVKNIISGLSALTIGIPEDATDMIGMFYLVTKCFGWENIPITEIISTWSEMSYIISTKDVPRAFEAVKKLIEENR